MHPGVKPNEPAKVKKYPVRLRVGYFPADPDHPRHPVSGDSIKVKKGEVILLPLEEANDVIKRQIGVRADQEHIFE